MPIGGIGSNAMCNSNVKVTFGGVGASGRKEDDVDADLTMSIGLSMAFGAVAMFCRVFAIARASKVSMRHAMFVNPFQRQATIQRQLTMRQQQRGGARKSAGASGASGDAADRAVANSRSRARRAARYGRRVSAIGARGPGAGGAVALRDSGQSVLS